MNRKLNQYILNFIHQQAISYILAIDFFLYQILQLPLPMWMTIGCNISVVALVRLLRVSFARRMAVAALSRRAGRRNLARLVRCSQVMCRFIRLEVTKGRGQYASKGGAYRSQSEAFGESVVLLRWWREFHLGVGLPFRKEWVETLLRLVDLCIVCSKSCKLCKD